MSIVKNQELFSNDDVSKDKEFCSDCGTEETPDVMGNCTNCGKYIKTCSSD